MAIREAKEIVGENLEGVWRYIHKEEPKEVRFVPHGKSQTDDYRPYRLTVWFDENHRVLDAAWV